MPISAFEGSQGIHRPIFFLDLSRDCIFLQDSFNTEIVADGAAVRPPHAFSFPFPTTPHNSGEHSPEVNKVKGKYVGLVMRHNIS
jgi:hypothetical protein